MAGRAAVREIKTPEDRLGKKHSRKVVVGIYLDDTLAEVHDEAVQAREEAIDRQRITHEVNVRTICRSLRVLHAEKTDDEIIALAEDTAKAAETAEMEPLDAAVAEALAALDAGTQWFVFESIGRREFQDMVLRHPPEELDTELHHRLGGEGDAAFEYEGMARELVPASCAKPKITEAQWEDIFTGREWNRQELAALFTAALSAQVTMRTVTHRRSPRADVL